MSYSLSPFTMNAANQLYYVSLSFLPGKDKKLPKMYEEHITHTEQKAHQSNLQIDFLLLSRTFLPVSVAYKMMNNHGFS